MRRTSLAACVVPSLFAGCSSAPPPVPAPPEPPAASAPPPMAAPKPAPYSFAASGPVAPWKVASRDGAPPLHPLARPHLVAAGKSLGIVRAQGGWFAIHETRGVSGPLAVPDETVWMGIDGEDALYAANREGALFRVDSLDALRSKDGWSARAKLVKPTSWDATVGLLVAATPEGLLASSDRGATFQPLKLPAGFVAHTALARPDSVIVAASEDEKATPLISSDRGRTWRASTTPATHLRRLGARITASAPCPAVLAKDGKTWLRFEPEPPERAALGWERAVLVSTVAAAYPEAPRESATWPAAPDAKSGEPAEATCEKRERTGLRGGVGVAEGPRCQLAECLRGATEAPPDPTPTEFELIGAATCSAKGDATKCADDAPHSHEPSVGFANPEEKTLSLAKIPAGCRPARALAAGGLALLACTEGATTKLYAADPKTPLALETTLPIAASELGSLAMAKDGTLLLRASWGSDKRAAFVRKPMAVGATDAWRAIELGDALELRVVPNGGVLVLRDAKDDALAITLDGVDGRKELFARVPLGGHLVDASVENDRLVLWTLPEIHRGRVAPGTPAARGDAQPRWLSVDGTLER